MKEKKKQNRISRFTALALLGVLVTTSMLATTLAKYTKKLTGYDEAKVAKFEFIGTLTSNTVNRDLGADAELELFRTVYENVGGRQTVKAANGDKVIAPGVGGHFSYAVAGKNEVDTRLSITIKEEGAAIPIFYYYNDPRDEVDGKYYANNAAIAKYEAFNSAGELTKTLWINISDSNYPNNPVYTKLDSSNYGGGLANLAEAFSGDQAANNGVIPANTNLAEFSLGSVNWYWPFEVVEEDSTLTGESADAVLVAANTYGKFVSDTVDTPLGLDGTDKIKLKLGATLTQVD